MKYKALYLALFGLLTSSAMADWKSERLEKARQGDVSSQRSVADDYCFDGAYYQALEWYEKAAKQDYELAQYLLAEMYYEGKCLMANSQQAEPNYAKALEWYSRLAYKDKPEYLITKYNAQLHIADIYFWEKGGIKGNGQQAKSLFTQLANIPDSVIQEDKLGKAIQETRGNARYRLAQMYFLGKLAPKDPELAYQWAQKAVNDRHTSALAILSASEYLGVGTRKNVAGALDKMRRVCESGAVQGLCDLYERMKKGLPLD